MNYIDFINIDEMIEPLLKLREHIDFIIKNERTIKIKDLSWFAYRFEKTREKVYNYFRSVNDRSDINIEYINEYYFAYEHNNIIKLYIPEMLPKTQNTKLYISNNIKTNIARVCSKYKDKFKNDYVFLLVKIYDRNANWDCDNKQTKPIHDGLVDAGVIKDDSIENTFYCVQGIRDDIPHTEVYITKSNKISDFLKKNYSFK